LNVLIFLIGFAEPLPERLGLILLDKDKKEMEAGFGPFRLLFVDLVKKFQSK
jgi:hypothetical protein